MLQEPPLTCEEIRPFGVEILVLATVGVRVLGSFARVTGAALGGFAQQEGCQVWAAAGQGADEIVHGARGVEVVRC